jgi:hypothetical protein
MNGKEIAEIGKEYFGKLLKTEETKELIKIGNREKLIKLKNLLLKM